MALTRAKITNVDSSQNYFTDPMTVLRQGATSANVDVGFLFNRANGLVSNVALYWSESGNTFVTAFTSNTGVNNGNILVSSYTNLATGALSVTGTGSFTGNLTTGHILPSANITYDIGSPTLRFRTLYISGNTIDMGGAQITTDTTSGGFAFVPKPTSANPNPLGTVFSPTGAITTINTTGGVIAAGAINTSINNNQGTANFGNVKINSDVSSTSTTTGALVVTGGAGISGSLYVGAVTSSGTIISSTVNAATIGNAGATLTGTLSTAAQTNITSVGTLTSLTAGAVTSSGTIIASTVNAATIGNAGATLTGTVSTATQNSVTTMTGLTAIGAGGTTTTIFGNLAVGGNLTVTGNSVSIGASTLSIADPIISLNTPSDLTPLTTITTADIGLKFHYYDTSDQHAFLGRAVDTGYLEWYSRGNDTANVFTGTVYGTIKSGAIVLANTASITAAGTIIAATVNAATIGNTGATLTGTLSTATQTNITSVGTLTSLAVGAVTSSGTVIASIVNAATIGNTGATLTGTLSTAAQTNITSVGTLTSLAVGAVTSSGTVIASTVNAATIGNTGATLTGTLSTATQTNITSVGTLTSLAVGAVTSSGTIIASTVNAATIGNSGAVYNGSTLTLTSYANIAGPVALINNTTVVSLQITGTATKGGAGYHDFLSVTNQGAGGTNTNKFFRTNSTGNFEIINSAYTQNILTLTDDGNISIPGKATINALYTTTGLFWSGNGYPISTGGGGSAAGVSGQVQYNNTGSFGGTALYYFSGNSAHVTTGNIVADQIHAVSNGSGTNFRVGDDAWLGDINIANTVGLRGQQDATQGYIVFGNSNNTTYIGRSGTNPITVTGAFSVTGTITAATVNAATIGNISANHWGTGTYLTSLNASNLSSGTVPSAQISGSYTGITGVGALAAGSITTGFTTIPVAQGGTGVTTSTGTGSVVLNTSPTLVTPALGTPTSGNLANCTDLPISTGISGLASGVATFLATPSSVNLRSVITNETGTGVLVFGTAPTISLPVIDNIKLGYTATATAAGTTTLTASSNCQQLFTGSTTQTVVLPVTSTLVAGMGYYIENNSTSNLTVNSSGGNLVATVIPGTNYHVVCIGTTLTTAADWDGEFTGFGTLTGTGSVVLSTSPTFVTPALGTPASGTLTNCTFPTLNQNTTGTAAGLSATLAVASGGTGVTTSTGTGSVVLSSSPTLVTPALGTPSSGTLTNCTFPTLNQNTTGTAAGLSATLAVASGGTGVTTSTGTGSVVLNTSPTFVTPALGTPASGTLTNCTFPTLNQNTTGSAATLTTARAINGVNFDGSAAITVTAAAGTLSGGTLNSGVTASSLTSVGNLTSLSVSGTSSRGGKALVTNYTGTIAPASPQQGDEWWYTTGNTLYKYIYDGTGYSWVNITPALFNASASATADTLALRDASANLYATNFIGIASSAKYADLAEVYVPDRHYEPGTVVVFGGDQEITTTNITHDTRVAGIVSTAPAYLMNSECVGLPVALTGRVPCLVKGPVTKGQLLVTSAQTGIAKAIDNSQFVPGCVIGKSLENITTDEIATIEVAVGRF
jgi:hypothetical protein